ncbi:MAG: cell division protein FtsW [Candidatus Staskawiczbacteria bacterium]|nr:cell division protein FtsW [Candidatus Staskawiczbacteria bacterium]
MKKHFNYPLFFLSCLLAGSGLLFLATTSALASLRQFGTANYYIKHQLLFGFVPGLIFAAIAYKFPLDKLKKLAPVLFALNLLLMLLVFAPFIGSKFYGAHRWISIGKITFQPSELLKITSVLYLSAWIASKFSKTSAKGWILKAKKSYYNLIWVFVPFIVFLSVISVILKIQPDISTMGIIGLTLIFLYFSSGTPFWHTIASISAGIAGLFFLITTKSYRFDRWLIFINPGSDPLGKGQQLNQSLIAIGSGGFFGKGLGMSAQKFGFLPQAMTDSIFAVFAEETGILGSFILVSLFVLFCWMGFKIAKSTEDKFARLTAIGITFWIVFQALVNISSVAGIFPLSGIPLPFFSYGGSHLITELVGVGLLLNISKNG